MGAIWFLIVFIVFALNAVLVSLAVYWFIWKVIRRIDQRLAGYPKKQVWRVSLSALLAVLLVYAVFDTVSGLPRHHYAEAMSTTPVVIETVPLPESVTLIGLRCDNRCLDRLVRGQHKEVFRFYSTRGDAPIVERITVARMQEGSCPIAPNQAKLEDIWESKPIRAMQAAGICPAVESAALPLQGIFIVSEHFGSYQQKPPVLYRPKFLTAKVPDFFHFYGALEVQKRTEQGVELLGRIETYQAPGFLGFPPLIGCFGSEFDFPQGEYGCGIWRRTIEARDNRGNTSNEQWVYAQGGVFKER